MIVPGLRASVRAYRILTRLLPADLRRSHGKEIVATFEAQYRDAWRGGNWLSVGRLWLRTCAGLLSTATLGRVRRASRRARINRPRSRPSRPELSMESLLQDLRLAGRQVRRHPGFALVAVLSVAVGVGATTAVFSVVNTLLLRPPTGIGDADRVVDVGRTLGGCGFDSFSWPEFQDYRAQVPQLAELTPWRFTPVSFSGGGRASTSRRSWWDPRTSGPSGSRPPAAASSFRERMARRARTRWPWCPTSSGRSDWAAIPPWWARAST